MLKTKRVLLGGVAAIGLIAASAASAQFLEVTGNQTVGTGTWSSWTLRPGSVLNVNGQATINTSIMASSIYATDATLTMLVGGTITNSTPGVTAIYFKGGSARLNNVMASAQSAVLFLDGAAAEVSNSTLNARGNAATGLLMRVSEGGDVNAILRVVDINSDGYGIDAIVGRNSHLSITYGTLRASGATAQTGVQWVAPADGQSSVTITNADISSERRNGLSVVNADLKVFGSRISGVTGIAVEGKMTTIMDTTMIGTGTGDNSGLWSGANYTTLIRGAIMSAGNGVTVTRGTLDADFLPIDAAGNGIVLGADTTLAYRNADILSRTGNGISAVASASIILQSASIDAAQSAVLVTAASAAVDIADSTLTAQNGLVLTTSGAARANLVDTRIVATATGIEFSNGQLDVVNSTITGGDVAFHMTGYGVARFQDSTLTGGIVLEQKVSPPPQGAVSVTLVGATANGAIRAVGLPSEPTPIVVNAFQSEIFGDVIAQSGAVMQIGLHQQSILRGAVRQVDGMSIGETGQWQIPAGTRSTLSSFMLNDGAIRFSVPGTGGFSAVTLGGNWTGSGQIHMNTDLAALQGDHISVGGNTIGTQTIFVSNHGDIPTTRTGIGPTDGLRLVSVGGSSQAEFRLGNPVVVGIYDYALVKADNQNWYLQSGEDEVPGPRPPVGPVRPVEPPVTVPPTRPHIVDTIGGYVTVPGLANRVLRQSFANARDGILGLDASSHDWNVWSRASGWAGSYTSRHAFDASGLVLQTGADYALTDTIHAGDRAWVGGWFGYSWSSADIARSTASIRLAGPQVGLYALYNQEGTASGWGSGLTLDAMAAYSWLQSNVEAQAISHHTIRAAYDVSAWGLSMEAGYGFPVGEQTVIRPLLGLTYSQVATPVFADSARMQVRSLTALFVAGSMGLRVEHWLDADRMTTVWAYGGAEYEASFRRQGIIANGVALANNVPAGMRGTVAFGIKGTVTENVEVIGSLALTAGRQTSHEVRGTFGLQARF